MYTAPARTVLPPELDPRIGRRRRPRQRGLRRLLALLTVLLSVLVVVTSTGGYVVVRWFNGSIARIQLNFGDDRPPSAEKGEQNWLLAGTDSRAGTGDEFGGDKVTGERSDTTILAHLDADGTTTLVSIPRDTLVTIPAYDDDKGVGHPARQDKFNAAILSGGPSLMVRTVEAMTGIRVDHYVSVDLAGFRRITDAIGGVNVCIKRSRVVETGLDDNGRFVKSTNLSDPYSGFSGHVGVNHLNGEQALAFVRQRHGLEGGDTARIQRQQQFLGEVFRNATSTGVLLNPGRVSSLIGAVRDSLTLDQDTSLSDLEKLAGRMRGLDPGRLRFETVPTRELRPTDPGAVTIGGVLQYREPGKDTAVGSVLLVDQTKFDDLLARLRGAAASPQPSTSGTNEPPAPVTVPPSQVLVTAQNGSTTPGLARKATDELGRQGFRTFTPVAADATTYGASEVRFAPGQEDSAKTVAAAVPGSVLKTDPTAGNGIILVVGSSYTGTRKVVVAGSTSDSATPSPSASASASASPSTTFAPPPVTAADPGNRCTF